MRLKGPASKNKKSPLARGLLLCMTFTLLTSLAFGLWSYMSRKYDIVLDPKDIEIVQLDPPKQGDPIAVMHTTAGDMTFRLYPENAPKAVESFCNLAKSGYYDNTYVFDVEPGIYFSAGSADADGNLPQGVSGSAQERVKQELSPKMWPLRGALCALSTGRESGFWKNFFGKGVPYNGSRFMVVDTVEMTEELIAGLHEEENEGSKKVADAFEAHGGIPNYSQQVTIFGQLIEGYEILDAITETELEDAGSYRKPKEEIRILNIEIGTFSAPVE